MKDKELKSALEECLKIMAYYHKSETGHFDSCENPFNCGHCQAVKKAKEALS